MDRWIRSYAYARTFALYPQVVLATSNRHPSDLYKGGINREAVFVPFIDLLQQRVVTHQIDSEGVAIDYRKQVKYETVN